MISTYGTERTKRKKKQKNRQMIDAMELIDRVYE